MGQRRNLEELRTQHSIGGFSQYKARDTKGVRVEKETLNCRLVLVLSHFIHVRCFATLWTVTCQLSCPWIPQIRILEWVVTPSSRDRTCVSRIGSQVLYH